MACAQEPSVEHGAQLFKQCAGCHGADGRNKAFGKSGIIAGQSAEDLMESIKFYRESEFKAHGTSLVMSKQTKNMSLQDISDVAHYISKLPK
ncbi:MAG: hypothetical protein OA34_00555 [Sulfurospirillum sp. MES]|nr:MAG: hypothetical protein OA34_00555 [Sulfurospirillum sp. MES]